MSPDVHLRVAGALQLLIAAAHLAFPAALHWEDELARLSPLNRQLFHVHTLFVCMVLLLLGALSLFAADALSTPTPLARLVTAGIAAFWALRLYCQWFVFAPGLWRGNRARTAIHLLLTLLWSYFTLVYTWARVALG